MIFPNITALLHIAEIVTKQIEDHHRHHMQIYKQEKAKAMTSIPTPLQSHAAKLLPLIQALAEGKRLQMRYANLSGERYADWITPADSSITGIIFDISMHIDRLRIKPEPKWRPWTMEELADLPMHTVFRVDGTDTVYVFPCISSTGKAILHTRNPSHYSTGAGCGSLFAAWQHSTDAGKTWLRCGVLKEGT